MSEIALSTSAKPLEPGHILGLREHIGEAELGDVKVDISTTGKHLCIETVRPAPYKALVIDLAPLIQGAIEALPDVPVHSLYTTERPETAK
jgi:hypothetical protein